MMCPKMSTKDGLEMQIGTNHFGEHLHRNLISQSYAWIPNTVCQSVLYCL